MGKVAMIISSITGCSRRVGEKAEESLDKAGLLVKEVKVQEKIKEIKEVIKKEKPQTHEVEVHETVRFKEK